MIDRCAAPTPDAGKPSAPAEMGRIALLCIAAFSFLPCGAASAAGTPFRPNLVIVNLDDMGIEAWNVTRPGDFPPAPDITPNIDALAAQGIAFTRVWNAIICSPGRASILMGGPASLHGVSANYTKRDPAHVATLDLESLPTRLRAHGYTTAFFGKWHLAGGDPASTTILSPEQHGFDTADFLIGSVLLDVTGVGAGRTYLSWENCRRSGCTLNTTYHDTDVANKAIAFIEKRRHPFFLYVAPQNAHVPRHNPGRDLAPSWYDDCDEETPGSDGVDCFKAQTEAADTEVGRIIDALDLSTTTICVLADNGQGSDGAESPRSSRRCKGTPYNGGVNVPMVCAGFGVTDGNRTSTALIQAYDLYATFLDLAGIPNPNAHSRSFRDLFTDASGTHRSILTHAHYSPMGTDPPTDVPNPATSYSRMARDSRYFLTQRRGLTVEEFYDLEADPYEASPLDTGDLTAGQRAAYDTLVRAIGELPK